MGRHGDFIATISGSTGIDAELDEIRVWTEARSQADLNAYMHKTMPDNGAFGPYPMDTVALYFRFECQLNMAENFHRLCSNAEWAMAMQLGTYLGPGGGGTDLVESLAPIEILVSPDSDNCPAAPSTPGPWSWSTWNWMGAAPEAASAAVLTLTQVDTDETERGGGESYYLDRQNVDCGDDLINGFQLRVIEGSTLTYRIQCAAGANLDTTEASDVLTLPLVPDLAPSLSVSRTLFLCMHLHVCGMFLVRLCV